MSGGPGVVNGSALSATLDARAQTYGAFEDNAAAAQALKCIIHSGAGWARMEEDQREALEMIASKIARIVTGGINHVDSWTDIAGYATLVERRLTGK